MLISFFRPTNGGKECSGESKAKWKICNSQVRSGRELNLLPHVLPGAYLRIFLAYPHRIIFEQKNSSNFDLLNFISKKYCEIMIILFQRIK